MTATVATTRAEGAGPVDALTKAMRHELEKWYPALKQMHLGTFTVAALDVRAHDSAAHVRVTVSFNADGSRAVDHGGRKQRPEPGRADGHRGWLPLLAPDTGRRSIDSLGDPTGRISTEVA